MHIWWLGQSGFVVEIDGQTIVFDPYLSDSLTEQYAATETPHERMTGLVVAPDAPLVRRRRHLEPCPWGSPRRRHTARDPGRGCVIRLRGRQ